MLTEFVKWSDMRNSCNSVEVVYRGQTWTSHAFARYYNRTVQWTMPCFQRSVYGFAEYRIINIRPRH